MGSAMFRTDFMKTCAGLAGASALTHFQGLAASTRGKVKITDIKGMLLDTKKDFKTLVKIETDAGLVGYGESGVTGNMFRSRLDTIKPALIGQDPLSIEKHYFNLTTQISRPHIPTISGIDMALWDLAGKILNKPVCTLLGGPFRDKIKLYWNTGPQNKLDPISCRDWAQQMRQNPRGWTTYKITFTDILAQQGHDLVVHVEHGLGCRRDGALDQRARPFFQAV